MDHVMSTPGSRALARDGVGWVETVAGVDGKPDPEKLRGLAAQAKAIGDRRTEVDAAWAEDRAARADLLSAVVDAIRPALRSCGSRIAYNYTKSREGATHKHMEVAGIYVGSATNKTKAQPGPEYTVRGEGRGRFIGSDLFLLVDGTWLELTYAGPWSEVPSEINHWRGERRSLGAVDVIGEYDVAMVMDALAAALAKEATGARAARKTTLTERAGRMRALATLVRSSL